MILDKQPTWEIIDSTKIQCGMACLRKYFFNYILGWSPKQANIHLEFGTAWHMAMEHLLLHGYSDDSIMEAFQLFDAHWRQFFSTMDDVGHKTPGNALRGLTQYCDKYRHDEFETLYTEVSGSILIDDKEQRLMHFRIDGIIKDERGFYKAMEHKTAGSLSPLWYMQWPQKTQIGTYIHAINCLYVSEPVKGVIVNAFCPHNAPQMKKDGTMRANAKDNEFVRLEFDRDSTRMNDWLYTTNWWYEIIQLQMEILKDDTDSSQVMYSFPKCTESCTDYGGCPYSDFCEIWPNPLRHHDDIQPAFVQKFWDPRNPDNRPTRATINLNKEGVIGEIKQNPQDGQ